LLSDYEISMSMYPVKQISSEDLNDCVRLKV
jgi:hypothetical protein